MHFLNRCGLPLRLLLSVAVGLLVAARPAVGWQFRDVTVAQEQSEPQDAPPSADDSDPLEPLPPDAELKPAPHTDEQAIAEPSLLPEETSSEVPDQSGEIRPMRFNRMTVGETTAEELKKLWGEPLKVIEEDGQLIWKFKIPPFRQVDVTISKEVTASALIYLDEPLEPVHVAEELGLDEFQPVPIPDAMGRVLGQAYPERGVLFSFTDGVDNLYVQRMQLEPISAELFSLRAEYDFQRQYDSDLADLETAIQLNPDFARAHWLRAKIMKDVGQFRTALKSAEAAVRLEPSSVEYRLTKSKLLAQNGQRGEALRQVGQVLASESLPAELHAYAECQMGDLLAEPTQRNYKQAMEHHLEAIRLAAPLADERRFAPRRKAKLVLIDAHLATAQDIAHGDFRRKEEVGPKWIDRARALVEDMIAQEQGDPVLRLRVIRVQLALYAELGGTLDLDGPTEEAITLGRDLIAADQDSLGQSRIQWELGQALFEAMRVARLQRDHESALSYANNAIVSFEQSAPKRQSTPSQKYLIGRLYFLVGTIHAVQIEDHQEAVAWYGRAEAILRDATEAEADAGVQGERFVSMGVSHWETGAHEKALQLTEYGLEIIQQAVTHGSATSQSLAVPFGNLAAMHSHVGNLDQAKEYAALAARLSSPSENRPVPR